MIKWISVKDELPENYIRVFLYGKCGFDDHKSVTEGFYIDGFFKNETKSISDVNYWAELPNLPE